MQNKFGRIKLCLYLCIRFRICAGTGRFFKSGLRGVGLLGNADQGDNAGSLYLNANNGVTDANVNWGAFLNKFTYEDEPSPLREQIGRWHRD